MHSALFFADVHLQEDAPDKTEFFLQFLQSLVKLKPEGVFILGDLFDYWIGDDACQNHHLHIAAALKELSQSCPLYFQHGNRDFLLGEDYAQRAGMQLLPSSYAILLDQHRVLLLHGDQLCSADRAYQFWRNVRENRALRRMFHALPQQSRQLFAKNLRQYSQKAKAHKTMQIMDVVENEAAAYCQQHHSDILIHGHIHRPAVHSFKHYTRYVLGDWHPQSTILYYHNACFELIDLQHPNLNNILNLGEKHARDMH